MQINTLKLKIGRKSGKIIGRGGKKGTYSGRGVKGQKARSGAKVNPLFEGGRSTLLDHMKKKRGFISAKPKAIVVDLAKVEDKFGDGDTVNKESMARLGIIRKTQTFSRIKVLGKGKGKSGIKKKLIISGEISISASAKNLVEKAGGKVEK